MSADTTDDAPAVDDAIVRSFEVFGLSRQDVHDEFARAGGMATTKAERDRWCIPLSAWLAMSDEQRASWLAEVPPWGSPKFEIRLSALIERKRAAVTAALTPVRYHIVPSTWDAMSDEERVRARAVMRFVERLTAAEPTTTNPTMQTDEGN